ncbi:MAG: MFS transporter, partial [Coriobacteriales bacterium]|nr:MFS transporter [Coriobacteriales bacterium]
SVTQAVGGVYIDRHDHRRLILVQSGVCGILWFTMGLLFVLNKLTFPVFFGLCLLASAIFGFLGGTTNAALIRVVGPQRYAKAESVNQGRDAAVNTAGSPIGAALYGFAHSGPFFASAVCDFISFLAALRLRLPARKDADKSQVGEGVATFFHDFVDGWRWVLKSRIVVSIIIVMALVSFAVFGVHQAVSLYLVAEGTDALLISLVNILSGASTMVGSLISARLVDRMPVGRTAPVILALMGCAMLPMIIAPSYPTILVSMMLAGLPMPLMQALSLGFIFSKTPVELQGRTRAAIMTSTMLFTSGTGAVAGSFLPLWGLAPVCLMFAALLAVGLTVIVLSPHLRSIPAPPQWETVEL